MANFNSLRSKHWKHFVSEWLQTVDQTCKQCLILIISAGFCLNIFFLKFLICTSYNILCLHDVCLRKLSSLLPVIGCANTNDQLKVKEGTIWSLPQELYAPSSNTAYISAVDTTRTFLLKWVIRSSYSIAFCQCFRVFGCRHISPDTTAAPLANTQIFLFW